MSVIKAIVLVSLNISIFFNRINASPDPTCLDQLKNEFGTSGKFTNYIRHILLEKDESILNNFRFHAINYSYHLWDHIKPTDGFVLPYIFCMDSNYYRDCSRQLGTVYFSRGCSDKPVDYHQLSDAKRRRTQIDIFKYAFFDLYRKKMTTWVRIYVEHMIKNYEFLDKEYMQDFDSFCEVKVAENTNISNPDSEKQKPDTPQPQKLLSRTASTGVNSECIKQLTNEYGTSGKFEDYITHILFEKDEHSIHFAGRHAWDYCVHLWKNITPDENMIMPYFFCASRNSYYACPIELQNAKFAIRIDGGFSYYWDINKKHTFEYAYFLLTRDMLTNWVRQYVQHMNESYYFLDRSNVKDFNSFCEGRK